LTSITGKDKLIAVSLIGRRKMQTVNIHDAKTHLSRLVDDAARGKAFIIAKAGKPLVKVVPLEAGEAAEAGRLGFMAGEIRTPDDFDRMGAEGIAALFEGKDL
jgi:prevent-host-death family protein